MQEKGQAGAGAGIWGVLGISFPSLLFLWWSALGFPSSCATRSGKGDLT